MSDYKVTSIVTGVINSENKDLTRCDYCGYCVEDTEVGHDKCYSSRRPCFIQHPIMILAFLLSLAFLVLYYYRTSDLVPDDTVLLPRDYTIGFPTDPVGRGKIILNHCCGFLLFPDLAEYRAPHCRFGVFRDNDCWRHYK